ncbi:MAG TPA: hypothetical protein VK203_12230 [Nostocaceae cyanobacterium]|nr:hypothetical protein [Nostocaceae cyanobacterium]
MSEVTYIAKISPIRKGIERIGLTMSEAEINALRFGQTISLADRGLGELGSLFILVSALSQSLLGKPYKTITFQDLLVQMTDSASCSGVPIYAWNAEDTSRCCLYLTMMEGIPAIRLGNISLNNCSDSLMLEPNLA